MKFYKRLLAMAIVATVFISVFAFGATAYGSDNNIPFSVKVPGYLVRFIQRQSTEVIQDRKFLGKLILLIQKKVKVP